MSDDLSAFFAKKKDKKKRNVVKMEDVGHILELKVKRQEENDQLQMDAEVRNVDDNEFQMRARVNSNTGGATSGEESEWIDYTDTNQGRLEGLKIKDMGADSGDVAEEDNVDDDDQKVHTESIRTWGQLEKKEEDHQNDDHFATFKAKTAYVIPAQRQAQMRGAQKVDISNNEMFPTLADASKIEKDKKEEAKSGGWLVSSVTLKSGGNQSATSESRPLSSTNRWNISSGPPPSAARERDNAIKAVAAYNAQNSAQSSLIMREKEPDPPKPGKYVPPHFRNRN
ncbi:hypothetical protein DICVIV_11065 [Dictyocaulus viviparus]|uniref:Uncharacterized protein n=1 Tax=Dictyocaulus viviparus TaxID=29172 RepID=A0A0D8XGT9_DICVI|nr:hypothetical protein DICVIV_11065 [Dictyocaulus viviparus]